MMRQAGLPMFEHCYFLRQSLHSLHSALLVMYDSCLPHAKQILVWTLKMAIARRFPPVFRRRRWMVGGGNFGGAAYLLAGWQHCGAL